jgi:hypothetical protein
MAEATITRKIQTADPAYEVVVLTVTDGETYTSRKFNSIKAAQATGNEDVDADLNVTYSGAVATINYAGQTDKLVTLQLWGH